MFLSHSLNGVEVEGHFDTLILQICVFDCPIANCPLTKIDLKRPTTKTTRRTLKNRSNHVNAALGDGHSFLSIAPVGIFITTTLLS